MDRNSRELEFTRRHIPVATREGGVDRNRPILLAVEALRRVATREGGVDRNIYWILKNCGGMGRHPRGWRG